jgi:hypothetical protein
LLGAKTGFQSFGAVMANADTTYYAVTNGTDWEVGIGTYSTTGPTMARTTILSSSNGGAAVSWAAGTKDIFLSYAAEKSAYLDASGSLLVADKIVHTGDTDTAIRFPAANTMSVETGGVERFKVEDTTITTTVPIALPANPTLALQAATKQYVDALIASGIHFHTPVRVESPTALTATYNNGASGVGATLTNAGTQVALVIDGVTVATNDRVLIYQQTNQTQNGVYTVTNTGSGSTNWVLTRSSDANTYVINNANGLSEGSTVFVQQGTTGAGETYTCNTSGTITFGTTNITFVQISSAQIYSAGSGLTLTGTVFAHADTSSQASVDNTGATFIQDVAVDTFGHVTSLTSTTVTPTLIGAAPIASPVFTGVVSFPDGSVTSPSITNDGDTNTGIFFPTADTIAFTEGGVESMRIDASGNLGLGVTPSAWLGAGFVDVPANGFLGGNTGLSSNSLFMGVNAYYGTGAWRYKASSLGAGYYQQNSGQHAFFTAPSGTAGNAITFTQAMTLDASGNLGIGTSSPTDLLQLVGGNILIGTDSGNAFNSQSRLRIQGAGDEWIQIKSDGTGTVGLLFGDTTDNFTAGVQSNQVDGANLLFYAGNAIRMEIDSAGNLGVGTTNPLVKLHVSSGANDEVARFEGTGNPYISLYDSGVRSGYFFSGPSVVEIGCEASKTFSLVVNGAQRLTVDGSGNLTATGNVTAYSDARLKEDLEPITDALAKVQSLTGYTYTRIDTGERHTGLIAQDVQEVLPEAVIDSGDSLSLAYGNMVGLLVEAIKAQQVQIDELRAKLGV